MNARDFADYGSGGNTVICHPQDLRAIQEVFERIPGVGIKLYKTDIWQERGKFLMNAQKEIALADFVAREQSRS